MMLGAESPGFGELHHHGNILKFYWLLSSPTVTSGLSFLVFYMY